MQQGLGFIRWVSEEHVVAKARELSDRWAALSQDAAAGRVRGFISDDLAALVRNEQTLWMRWWQQCNSSWWCRAAGGTYDDITRDWLPRYDRVYADVAAAYPPGERPSAPGPSDAGRAPGWLKALAIVGGLTLVGGLLYAVFRYYSGGARRLLPTRGAAPKRRMG